MKMTKKYYKKIRNKQNNIKIKQKVYKYKYKINSMSRNKKKKDFNNKLMTISYSKIYQISRLKNKLMIFNKKKNNLLNKKLPFKMK